MNYENIFKLQERGYDFEESKSLDARGITSDDRIALDKYEEERDEKAEHLQDLENRGFFYGTDDPIMCQQIEAQEAFQDKYDMYMNEY